MSDFRMHTEALFETGDPVELSLVDLVLVACEFSEDAGEVNDLVDGLVDAGRVHLMTGCEPSASLVESHDLQSDPWVSHIQL